MRLSVPVRVLNAIYKCNRVALCDSVSLPYILWYKHSYFLLVSVRHLLPHLFYLWMPHF